jgi:hypothetical protein
MNGVSIRFHLIHCLNQKYLNEIWNIYSVHHNVDYDSFLSRTKNQFTCIALYKCKRKASIVGFTGLRMEPIVLRNGARILTIYFGQTFVLEDYRGRQLLPWTGALFFLKSRLRHPLLPIYIWYDAISYKSYMILARNVRVYFPRRDVSTPATVREMIDQLGARHYPGQYEQATGRVIKSSNRLKEHVARLSLKDLEDPDIRYYATRNPGHGKGDGLLCVLPASMTNFVHIAGKVFMLRFLARRKTHERTG